MSRPYNNDDLQDLHDLHEPAPADREIPLGTGAILGIFLALVLICGAFFGFGYSMGHRNAPAAAASDIGGPVSTSVSSSKPTVDSPGEPAERGLSTGAMPTVNPRALPWHARDTAGEAPAERAAPSRAAAAAPARPSAVVPSAPAGAGVIYVQVSAVSHAEDAQSLVTALKRRGYVALIRHVPQDALLHVQIGPFPAKKEAEAARQRLIADGYNAILK